MSLDLRRHIGQLIVVGFAGNSLPVELCRLAREFDLGGIILFSRNIEAPLQVAELSYEAQQLAFDLPLWVSVDQEGGRVQRLRSPFTEWPAQSMFDECDDLGLADRFSRALAKELSSVGINLNYAPVLDVHTNMKNPVIGDRAISSNPIKVSEVASAIIRALQDEGVAACGKHFPGHGDTSLDSHDDLPVVEQEEPRLRDVELVPFRSAIEADVCALMTAHVRYAALDAEHPATLSETIIEGLLRDQLGFDGLLVSDDMEMGAIGKYMEVVDASVKAVAAGCDMLLVCSEDTERQARIIEQLIYALEDGRLPEARVRKALERQRGAKEKYLRTSLEWRPPSEIELQEIVGNSVHEAIASELRELA